MKTYTLADIRALSPCYDPADKVSEDWTGTVADILRLENVEAQDRIWVATNLLDGRTNRLFAVWCAREALKLIANPDPRSVAACDTAERFANGEATVAELSAASEAAWAARAAAWAARAAAEAAWAAWAASAAAWAASEAAARAARAAAEAALAASARAAAEAASEAAWAKARAATRAAQLQQLLKMLEEK